MLLYIAMVYNIPENLWSKTEKIFLMHFEIKNQKHNSTIRT